MLTDYLSGHARASCGRACAMEARAEARRDGAKRRPAMRERARRRGASHERACGVPVRAHFFFLFASCRGDCIYCTPYTMVSGFSRLTRFFSLIDGRTARDRVLPRNGSPGRMPSASHCTQMRTSHTPALNATILMHRAVRGLVGRPSRATARSPHSCPRTVPAVAVSPGTGGSMAEAQTL